jgi:homoserine kinase type II
LIELTGRKLAKLHQTAAPEYLPTQLSFGKEQFVDVEKYAAHSSFAIWLKLKLAYISTYISSNLPRALIHADVFYDNVVVSEDESSVTIMDFEEAAYYYRVFDLGMMIIGICAEGETINFEKVRHMLNGYRQEIELLEIELNALQAFTVYAGTAMTFWRHQNFNYTKPDPAMYNHYLGLKVLADYVENQDVDFFLNLWSG